MGTVHIGLHVGCDASVKQARADEQDKPLDQIVDEPKRDPVDDAIEQGLTGVQNGLDKLVDSASDGLDELDKALDQVEDEPVTPEPSKADETPFLDQLGAALVKEINDGLDRLQGLLDEQARPEVTKPSWIEVETVTTIEPVVTIEYVVPEVVVETIEYITGTPFETVEAVEAVETVEVTEPTVTEPTVTEQMVANGSADVKQAVQVPAEVVRQAVVEPKAVTPKSEKADNSLAYTGAGDPLPIGLAGLSLVALDAMLARRKRTAPHN